MKKITFTSLILTLVMLNFVNLETANAKYVNNGETSPEIEYPDLQSYLTGMEPADDKIREDKSKWTVKKILQSLKGEFGEEDEVFGLIPWESMNNIVRFTFNTENDSLEFESITGSTGLTHNFGFDKNVSNGNYYLIGGTTTNRALYQLDIFTFEIDSITGLTSSDGNTRPQDFAIDKNGDFFIAYKNGTIDNFNLATLTATAHADVGPDNGAVGLTYDFDNDRLIYAYDNNPVKLLEITNDGTVNELFNFSTPDETDGTSQGIEYVGDGICISSSTYAEDIIYQIDLNDESTSNIAHPTGAPYEDIKDLMFLDNTAPVLTTKDTSVTLDKDGFATIEATDVIESASDNIRLSDTTISQASFNSDNIGENVIEVTVTDHFGNSTTLEAIVTVNIEILGISDLDTLYGIYPWSASDNIMRFTYNKEYETLQYDTIVGSTGLSYNFAFDQNPVDGKYYLIAGTKNERSLYELNMQTLELDSIALLISADGNTKPQDFTINANGDFFIAYQNGHIDIMNIDPLEATIYAEVDSGLGGVGLTYDHDEDRLLYTYHDNFESQVLMEVTSDGTVNELISFYTPGTDSTCSSQGIEYARDGICIVSSTYSCDLIYNLDLNNETTSVIAQPNGSPYESIKDLLLKACNNPTNGGTIGENQEINEDETPSEITNEESPSGHRGTLEYKWQKSTTGEDSGFSDISDSNADSYSPGSLSETTWYKRLAKVECANDWDNVAESNVVEITVVEEEETNDLNDLKEKGIAIYPNPTTGLIHLEFDKEGYDIRILSITGETIIQQSSMGKSSTIDLSGLKNNFYILQIQSDDENVINYKLLKND